MRSHFPYCPFAKGLAEWRAKHHRYAELEAAESLKSVGKDDLDRPGLVSFDPVRRRKALKELFFRLPGRPLLRFIYMFFLRMGCLDGWPGLRCCRLMVWHECMIVAVSKRLRHELRRAQR